MGRSMIKIISGIITVLAVLAAYGAHPLTVTAAVTSDETSNAEYTYSTRRYYFENVFEADGKEKNSVLKFVAKITDAQYFFALPNTYFELLHIPNSLWSGLSLLSLNSAISYLFYHLDHFIPVKPCF